MSRRSLFSLTRLTLQMILLAVSHTTEGASPPFTIQPEDTWRSQRSCGINCTYVMLKANGISIPYENLVAEISISEAGASLSEMSDALRKFGLANSTVRCTPNLLSELEMPLIAHLEFSDDAGLEGVPTGHFVVVTKFDTTENMIAYVDGTSGVYFERPLPEFVRSWSGVAIVKKSITWRSLVLAFAFGAGTSSLWLLVRNLFH